MRTLLICLMLLITAFQAQAELINVNPNPFGEPWYAGGWRQMTEAELQKVAALPQLTLTSEQKGKLLPYKRDNSTQPYFRSIFNQNGGSCAQASGIAYNFTYEVARQKHVSANTAANQFPSHYTWNFLNNGNGSGSTYFDGWDIIKANGCPTVQTYGGIWIDDYYYDASIWMNGYDKYLSGMQNRVTDVSAIKLNTPEGLQTLKQWMNDHLDGSLTGGIANFSAGVSYEDGFNDTYLPSGTPEAGKTVITKWGVSVNHAMTFIGYDDSIRYDVNNDGRYTNNLDINNDGVVNMRDWEIGGLIMANSWGNSFGDNGKAYVLYHLLAETVENNGINSNSAYVIHVRTDYQPKLLLKIKMNHNSRNKIKVFAGASADPLATTPNYYQSFPLFNYQGGDYGMPGMSGSGDLEMGLDVTPLLSELTSGQNGKIFLLVKELDANGSASGQVKNLSVINLTSGIPVETVCPQTNVAIVNNGLTSMSVPVNITYNSVAVSTTTLPDGLVNENYNQQLEATGGQAPYKWNIKHAYTQANFIGTFPAITQGELTFANNDDSYAVVNVGFNFPFYGKNYNQITVLTDGVIAFKEGFDYIRTESALVQNKCIAVYGADLLINDSENDGIFVKQEANKFTIRWKVSQFDHPEVNLDFAVELYSDGQIKKYYNTSMTPNLAWIGGISAGDEINVLLSDISNLANPSNLRKNYTAPDFPSDMSVSSGGIFQGVPAIANHPWNINFMVTDYNKITKSKVLSFKATTVGIEDNPVISAKLFQNYPNPFNPETNINYELQSSGNTMLSIYNAKGELVKELINEMQSSGKHYVKFDASGLNSGVYIYKLSTPEMSFTKKMLLVK